MESVKGEVKLWLEVALKNENLESLEIEIAGNTDKGQGYIGDVMFVSVNGQKQGKNKHYNLVLKCSKSNQTLLDNNPVVRLSYLNEMYVYNRIFPTFQQFQAKLGVASPFQSVPKLYGTFHNESRYVIALENLKEPGYSTWDTKRPLTRKHIDLVVTEYGKFHAVSVAMKEKKPEKFQELASGCKDIIGMLLERDDSMELHQGNLKYAYQLIKDEVTSETAQKWLRITERLALILRSLNANNDGLKVIVHGDCWNNNFMYKYEEDNITKVIMIDWQISKLTSPLTDLSYFLLSCISEEDIPNVETILKTYYDSFIERLANMGCDYASKYSYKNLLEDWKKYCIYGATFALLVIKTAFTDRENLPDIGEGADKGKDFVASFHFQVSDEKGYAKRILPIVKHVANNFVH